MCSSSCLAACPPFVLQSRVVVTTPCSWQMCCTEAWKQCIAAGALSLLRGPFWTIIKAGSTVHVLLA